MNAILCDKSFYIYAVSREEFSCRAEIWRNFIVSKDTNREKSTLTHSDTSMYDKNKHCVALSISVILIGGWEYIGGSHKRGGRGIQELLLLMEILREAMFKLSVGKFKMVDSRFEST